MTTPSRYPLSAAQAGVWMAQQLHPDRAIFRIGELMRIAGPLDPALFETALRRTVEETDNLHLRFTEDDEGRVWQSVETPGPWPLPIVDVTGDPAEPAPPAVCAEPASPAVCAEPAPPAVATAEPPAEVDRWIRTDLAENIDLDHGPLFRFALFRVGEQLHYWYHGYHHILTDGIGCALFVRRVAARYRALLDGAAAPEPTYGSVRRLFEADAAYRDSAEFSADRRYWHDALADWSTPVQLADRDVVPGAGFVRRATYLPAEVTAGLAALAERLATSRARLLVGAAVSYLGQVTGVDDVVVGLPLTGRVDPVTRGTPGLTVNVLPLRVPVDRTATVAQFIARVADAVRGAVRHQRYRGEDLYRELLGRPGRPRFFGPLVNVMLFDYDLRFGPCRTVTSNVSLRQVEDLAVTVYDRSDGAGLRIDLEANPARYDESTLVRLHEGFVGYLTRFAGADPASPVPAAAITPR